MISSHRTQGWEYSRSGNPTRDCLEQAFAALENGKHGFAFSSGLGATMTILQLLKAGDHVVAHDDLYGGESQWLPIRLGD